MTLRSLFLFIHVVSSMGVFGTLAIEGALLLRLRRAGTTEMREALEGFRLLRILAPLSLAPTVMSGMYLVRTVWGWRAAWINVAFASLVLAAMAGVTTTSLRVARLRSADGGPVGRSRRSQGDYRRDPVLSVSFVMRTAIFTGIVFLMTVKPELDESLVVIGVAIVGGILASLAVSSASLNLLSRVTWNALAVLLLTTVHHVYGAYVYHTPWRLHVAFVSGFAATAIIGSLLVLREHTDDLVRQIAFWAFAGVTLVIPVAAIGLFEGGYNHALKDALYFAGASTSLMTRLFPPPAYEWPNNAFFEITGVMQLVPASLTGWLLYRLVRSRLHASISSTHVPVRMVR
jgi:hypothetical protein